jgi:hypothetical protein
VLFFDSAIHPELAGLGQEKMYLRPRTRFAFIAFLATGATALTIPAQAQAVWVDGTGSWFVPGDCSAGVPGAREQVRFRRRLFSETCFTWVRSWR